MNFLAHAHLSFNEPQILVGNLISDFVKGKKQFHYPPVIQKGIQLHRAIDTFTDTHECTKQIKLFFKPHYRLYSGAFTDVIYDHFLANDTAEFSTEIELKHFAENVYKTLETAYDFLPENFQTILPFMIQHNWLYNYKNRWGIEKSFTGLVKRSLYLNESQVAFELFNSHYTIFHSIYQSFFPDLKNFALHKMKQLLNE